MSEFSFEQAIGAMLQDPEQMQKIFALAQSLGFSPPAAHSTVFTSFTGVSAISNGV